MAAISVNQVKELRAGNIPGGVDLVLLARLGLTLTVIVVLVVTWWLLSRRKARG